MNYKPIKAEILPLEGKYYGTKIEISYEPDEDGSLLPIEFTVWTGSEPHRPSTREIEYGGYTEEDWQNNILIDHIWGGKVNIQDLPYFHESHMETQGDYLKAKTLVDIINSGNKLESFIDKIQALTGPPDPSQACRNILKECEEFKKEA